MTATWLRVETDRPARIQAPAHAPPPPIEGLDRLFEAPLALRKMQLSLPAAANSQETMHLFQFSNEDRMGTVRVTCGGIDLDTWDAQTMATFAVNALRSSSTKGAGLLLDSCCSRTSIDVDRDDNVRGNDDGSCDRRNVSSCNAQKFLRDQQLWVDNSAKRRPLQDVGRRDRWALYWEALKPCIHRFASSSGAIPLHPFVCLVERRRALPAGAPVIVGHQWMIHSAATATSHGLPSNASSASTLSPDLQRAVGVHRQSFRNILQVYRGIFFTMGRCLSDAFPRCPCFSTTRDSVGALTHASMNTTDAIEGTGGVFFYCAYNLGGLVFASKSFVQSTSQWEKVLVSSLAMDMLVPKGSLFDSSEYKDAASAVRVSEIPMKMTRMDGQRAVDVVILSVGSALSFVFALVPSQALGVKGSVLADSLRSKLTRSTISPVYTKLCHRHNASANNTTGPTQDTGDRTPPPIAGEDRVPLFAGLEGRGTGSLQKHIELCTTEPSDVASAKLLDELTSSDDEAEESTFCGCSSATEKSGVASFGERSSERILSAVGQDVPESLVVRYAAKMRKADERCVSALVVIGGCFGFRVALQSDALLEACGPHSPPLARQKQLGCAAFQAFEVSLWRYALPHARRTDRCMHSILQTMSREAVHAVESHRQCRGVGIQWEPHFTYANVGMQDASSTSILQHTKRVLAQSEPCAVLTVSAAVDSGTLRVQDAATDAAVEQGGFGVSTKVCPFAIVPEVWRVLRSFSALSEAAMAGCLMLQRSGTPLFSVSTS